MAKLSFPNNTDIRYFNIMGNLRDILNSEIVTSFAPDEITYASAQGSSTLTVSGLDFKRDSDGNFETGRIHSFTYKDSANAQDEFNMTELNVSAARTLSLAKEGDGSGFLNTFISFPLEIFGTASVDSNVYPRAMILNSDTVVRLYDGEDNFQTGSGNDRLFGGRGQDKLQSNGGDDRIWGQQGNDTLKGEGGNDVLRGGAGRDILIGGNNHDRLIGGAGKDIFVFGAHSNRDVVVDFEIGIDKIYHDARWWGEPEIHDTNRGARMDFRAGSVLFLGVEADDLTPGHFTDEFPL